ncbi:hypothetical protein [Bacillus sp. FJAT-52991]|uniref:Uncharacterized protein n=1 Tax=Bacillus kandeliae TaxID=3129297 RepID=A0ABZ2N388_9BACI
MIGIIVNIFKRFSDNEKDKKSPGPVAQLPKTKKKAKKKKTVNKLKPAMEEVKVEIDPHPRQLEQRIGSVRQERLKVKEEKRSSYEIEEEDVLKGIIFSQVLGPPKARRRK